STSVKSISSMGNVLDLISIRRTFSPDERIVASLIFLFCFMIFTPGLNNNQQLPYGRNSLDEEFPVSLSLLHDKQFLNRPLLTSEYRSLHLQLKEFPLW